jgi:hypothetical protein
LLAALARRSCSPFLLAVLVTRLVSSLVASIFCLVTQRRLPHRRSCSPFLLAGLARRSCSPVLLAVLARRSCSRWIFQLRVGRARHKLSTPSRFVKLASSASSPESFPALLARIISSLVTSILPCCPASSSASQPLDLPAPSWKSSPQALHPFTFCQARQLRLVSRFVPSLARPVSCIVSSLVTSILPCCPASSPASFPSSHADRPPFVSSVIHGALLPPPSPWLPPPAPTAAPFYCVVARRRTPGLTTCEDPRRHAWSTCALCLSSCISPI